MAQEDSKIAMILVLTVIVIISTAVLTFMHSVTQPEIEAVSQQRREAAILGVLPGAESYENISKDGLEMYEGYDANGNLVGTAIQREGSGYGGAIELMIGMDLENEEILAVRVLGHSETPGLGARITEDWFEGQFADKNFSDEFLIGEDLETISGATISAQAVGGTISNTVDRVEIALAGGMEQYIAGLILQVLPGAEDHETVTQDGIEFHKGYAADGSLLGYVVTATANGYGGEMELKVGVDLDAEEILGVTVVDHSETTGIGDAITEADFQEQFVGKNFADSFSLGDDVDAATGATVSSRAFVGAVRAAVEQAQGLN